MRRRFDDVRTQRLVMRRWREEDRDPFAAMSADPEVMRYFPAPLDRAASDALVDRIEDLFRRQGFGLWRSAIRCARTSLTAHAGRPGLTVRPPARVTTVIPGRDLSAVRARTAINEGIAR